MDHYFKSHGYIPEGKITNSQGHVLDIAGMPAILRTLLVTDGTVTKTLEAYFWEAIAVVDINQNEICAAKSLPFLGCQENETLLDRHIRLEGQTSKTSYAFAQSFIRIDLLPKQIADDLRSGLIGIGEILRETGLETYRELVDLGENKNFQPFSEEQNTQQHCIYRTYRIMINHVPTIQVSEFFPRSTFS